MPKNRRSFLNKMGIAGLGFLLFLGFSILFVGSQMQQNERRSLQYLLEATERCRIDIEQQIESDFQVMRGVAISLGEMDLTDTRRVENILFAVNRTNTFVRMGFSDLRGRVDLVDMDGSLYRGVDISHLPVFSSALRGEEAVSETFYDEATGDYVNYYVVPVTQKGELSGVLCAIHPASVLGERLAAPVFRGQGVFYLLDQEGRIVAPVEGLALTESIGAPFLSFVTFPQAEGERFLLALGEGREERFLGKKKGEEQRVLLMDLDENGWRVASVTPSSAINEYYGQAVLGFVVVIIGASLLFLLLMIRQMRLITLSQQELERLAYSDELTGARNYRKFLIDGEAVLAADRMGNVAIWSFDIKKFGAINDVFGTPVGDGVLRTVAGIFEDLEKRSGAPFCRLSADQFVGMLFYREKKDVTDWFDRLCEILARQQIDHDIRLFIDVALGVYCPAEQRESLSLDAMANRASTAKRAAKELAGSELVFFTAEMGERLQLEAALEAGASAALTGGEIDFMLQPKVGIHDGYHVVGAEALARWHHARHGFLSPAYFIPLFENNGFIVEMDRYLFRKLCHWYRQVQDLELPEMRYAINVSRQAFARNDFVAYYTQVKEEYQVPDGVLELEFTESIIQEDYRLFRDVVVEMQAHGFICSIDDFGSGYSSLNVLKQLPIDVLKLDGVFFRGEGDLKRERIVISDLIAMAKKLGIKTVAEGVETCEQVDFLREAGCDVVQGYVFSKPVLKDRFLEMVLDGGIVAACEWREPE